MHIQVRLFAALAESAGTRAFLLDIPPGADAGAVREAVLVQYPQMRGLCGRAALAVNAEYAGPDRIVQEGDEVALIPPVSGG
jgi:molybdopterin converting factor subunit 1